MWINLKSLFVSNVGSLGSSSNQARSIARVIGSLSSFALGSAPVWREGEMLEHGKAWLWDGGGHAWWGLGLTAHQVKLANDLVHCRGEQ